MRNVIRGRVWAFGDDVNTDVITPGKYLTLRDPAQLTPLSWRDSIPTSRRRRGRET